MSDFLKSVFDAWSDRIRSPIIGSVFLVYVACNWKALFYLFFADVPVAVRLAYFELETTSLSLWIIPLIGGMVLSVAIPWVKFVGAWVAQWAELKLSILQETQASGKRTRAFQSEVGELKAKTSFEIAKIQEQGRIRAAEENSKIEAEKLLKKAGGVSSKVKDELVESRKAEFKRVGGSLSEKGREILTMAARDKSGEIMMHAFIGGTKFSAGGQELEHDGSRRSMAEIEGAIEELEEAALIRPRGSKREIFELTQRGFDVAEVLQ